MLTQELPFYIVGTMHTCTWGTLLHVNANLSYTDDVATTYTFHTMHAFRTTMLCYIAMSVFNWLHSPFTTCQRIVRPHITSVLHGQNHFIARFYTTSILYYQNHAYPRLREPFLLRTRTFLEGVVAGTHRCRVARGEGGIWWVFLIKNEIVDSLVTIYIT